MAYVYRHIRLDKNEPFYIGIGKDESQTYFKRAFNRASRNAVWKRVVAKTEYIVEIMMTGLTWEEAQQKEREFIALYGRISDGGILANMTIGGEGHTGMYGKLNPKFGVVVSEETKRKMRISYQNTVAQMKERTWIKKKKPVVENPHKKRLTPTQLENFKASRQKMYKPVIAFNARGLYCMLFKSLMEASQELNIFRGCISNACKRRNGKYKTYKGYIWEYASKFPDNESQYVYTVALFEKHRDPNKSIIIQT